MALACGASTAALRAQEVYRASWTIQDRSHGIEQQLAAEIIEDANDWLTRDNPNASTARVDDPLRVTVVGELAPGGGIRMRLCGLVLGGIALDTGFTEFLDSATINRLIRRDHYWRDELVEVYNPELARAYAGWRITGTADAAPRGADAFAARALPRLRLGLDRTHISIDGGMYAWAGLGLEEIGLYGFGTGRARAGVAAGTLQLWADVPTPIGSRTSPFAARGFEGAFGLGMAFEQFGLGRVVNGVGGMISAANAPARVGAADSTSGARYILGKSATLYGIAQLPDGLIGGMSLRLKFGASYAEAVPAPFEPTSAVSRAGAGHEWLGPLIRLELASLRSDGALQRECTAGITALGITASYQEQITDIFGLKVAATLHRAIAGEGAILPASSIFITPIISIR